MGIMHSEDSKVLPSSSELTVHMMKILLLWKYFPFNFTFKKWKKIGISGNYHC